MSIHIGELIEAEVNRKRLTYKEFGALIHRNEKTIPDIYDRSTMSMDLLVNISAALKKDFLSAFYTEEPMKSLRDDEIAFLQLEVQNFKEQIQKITEEIQLLQTKLTLTKDLNEAQKEIISLIKEQLADHKSKLANQPL